MTLKDSIKTLSDFNRWRRGDTSIALSDTGHIGNAIDFAIEYMKNKGYEQKRNMGKSRNSKNKSKKVRRTNNAE